MELEVLWSTLGGMVVSWEFDVLRRVIEVCKSGTIDG